MSPPLQRGLFPFGNHGTHTALLSMQVCSAEQVPFGFSDVLTRTLVWQHLKETTSTEKAHNTFPYSSYLSPPSSPSRQTKRAQRLPQPFPGVALIKNIHCIRLLWSQILMHTGNRLTALRAGLLFPVMTFSATCTSLCTVHVWLNLSATWDTLQFTGQE